MDGDCRSEGTRWYMMHGCAYPSAHDAIEAWKALVEDERIEVLDFAVGFSTGTDPENADLAFFLDRYPDVAAEFLAEVYERMEECKAPGWPWMGVRGVE